MESQIPQVVGPAEKQTPIIIGDRHLDTSVLVAQLDAIKPQALNDALAFDPNVPESFMKCVSDIAVRVGEAWAEFGKQCEPYAEATRSSRDALREWPTKRENILETVKRQLEVAKDEVRNTLRNYLMSATDHSVQKREKVRPDTRSESQKIGSELEALVAGVTGRLDGDIPARNNLVSFWVGGVASVLFGVVEVMAGTDFFRQVGSIMGAVGTMVILVVLLSVTAVGLGMSAKRCLYWVVARRAFQRNFPDEVIPGTEQKVTFFPLAPKWPVIFSITFTGLLVGSLALVSWRLRLAHDNPLLQGTAAIAWIVFAAVWFLAFLEFFVSPEYEPKHHLNYEHLKEREYTLREAGEPIQQGPDHGENDDGLVFAKRQYQERINESKDFIAKEIAGVRNVFRIFLLYRDEYLEARDKLVLPFFWRQVNTLTYAIGANYDGDSEKFAGELMEDRISKLFERFCKPWLDDDEFLFKVETFRPEIHFPEGDVIDVDKLYRDLKAEILAIRAQEIRDQAQSGLYPPVLFGKQHAKQSNQVAGPAIPVASADD